MITHHRRPLTDRVAALEQLLRTFTARYGPDNELTRQVARNLATARAARAEARDDGDPDDDRPEAAS